MQLENGAMKIDTYKCPHCNTEFSDDGVEEATFSGIVLPGQPNYKHIICPACKHCIGCPAKESTKG